MRALASGRLRSHQRPGTRRMLGAAQEAGARRFIHIGAEVALPILFPWVQAAGEAGPKGNAVHLMMFRWGRRSFYVACQRSPKAAGSKNLPLRRDAGRDCAAFYPIAEFAEL